MNGADVDVVVVGSGAAGLSAALAARGEGARVLVAEAGPGVGGAARLPGGWGRGGWARVLVAESESVIGGATRLPGGWVMAAGTDVQRAAQFDDRPDDLYH